jgi:hypothetical protein
MLMVILLLVVVVVVMWWSCRESNPGPAVPTLWALRA